MTTWPNQAGVRAFFGEPGSPACTSGKVKLPAKMRIAWDKETLIPSFSCHAKVADALTSIFTETYKHYGEGDWRKLGLDLFGGCYNYRKMRGGSSWSMHSWGIAVDLDPANNQLKWGRDRATFAKPVYEPFWKIVESHGFTSLGRKYNYDYMHLEATSGR